MLRVLEEGEAAFIARSAENYAALAAAHAVENAKTFAELEVDKARRKDRCGNQMRSSRRVLAHRQERV